MLDELRSAAARQREQRALRAVVLATKKLLSQNGEMNGMPLARELIDRLETLGGDELLVGEGDSDIHQLG